MRVFYMKMLTFIAIFCFVTSPLYANKTEAALTLDEYKAIVKGWHLNNHCKILTDNKARTVKSRLYNIEKHLNEIHDPKVITDIKENAKSVVKDPKYADCKKHSKRLIRKTPHRAQKIIREMHYIKYGLNTDEKKRLFSEYSTAKIGIDLDYQCDIFSLEKSDQIHDAFEDITDAILKIIPEAKKLHEKPSVRATRCKPNSHDPQIEVTLRYIKKLKKSLNL